MTQNQQISTALQGLKNDIGQLIKTGITEINQFVRTNPLAVTGGLGAAAATGVTIQQIIRKRKKRTTKKTTKRKKTRKKTKRKTTKRKTKRRTKKKRCKGRRTPHTAGKGKDRSTRRIRYTSKGQPYVILRSGKARFIKKSSAKRSHKLKGGRY